MSLCSEFLDVGLRWTEVPLSSFSRETFRQGDKVSRPCTFCVCAGRWLVLTVPLTDVQEANTSAFHVAIFRKHLCLCALYTCVPHVCVCAFSFFLSRKDPHSFVSPKGMQKQKVNAGITKGLLSLCKSHPCLPPIFMAARISVKKKPGGKHLPFFCTARWRHVKTCD